MLRNVVRGIVIATLAFVIGAAEPAAEERATKITVVYVSAWN